MSAPDGRKVALVLSGGGANGAYEVGVVKALLAGRSPATDFQPLAPDIVSGTSIGALNAAFLVSQWAELGAAAGGALERLWLERLAGGIRGNGVFRLRGNPLDLADPSAYLPNPLLPFQRLFEDGGFLTWDGLQRAVSFATSPQGGPIERRLVSLVDFTTLISLEPFEQMLRGLDYQAIRRSRVWLKIAATNWATGQLRVFWNHDMSDDFGPLAIRASAAVPGLLPPALVGSQPYVDGSVLMNAPLAPAIHAGAEILHVVYLDPDVRNIPLDRMPQAFGTFSRMMQIGWAAALKDDIGDAARVNRSLAALARARDELRVDASTASLMLEAAQVRPYADGEPMRPLEIRRYSPSDLLLGELGFLNFDRDRIEALIRRGFQDAIDHDSVQAQDVFPSPERAAAARRGDPAQARSAAAAAGQAPP